MKNDVETVLEKIEGGHKYEITKVPNSQGHYMIQFRIDGVVRYYYMTYYYEPDGVTSHLKNDCNNYDYNKELENLIAQFKIS